MVKQGNLLSKTLVIGIIFLFVIMSIIPSMAVDNVNINISSGKSSSDDIDWWPMFRHDLQHSGYSTSDAPDTNNVLWTYSTDGDVYTSPAVVDGKVYISSSYISIGKDVYCLDAKTGGHIWSNLIGGTSSSSPAVADSKVYIGTMSDLYCLDAFTGKYIWKYRVDQYEFSSPAVADGKVYIGTISPPNIYDCTLYCLNADTGGFIWSYKTSDRLHSSPAVADDKVYIASDDDNVYCLNATTGDFIWSYRIGDQVGYTLYSSPTVADGKVYIGSDDDNVYCLNATTGDFIWSYKTGSRVYSSPAVADGKVYIGSNDDNVYCLNATTGDFIWRYKTGNWVYSSPAVADGKVYIDSRDKKVYCLDANTGDYIWSYTVVGSCAKSSPAVGDGKVYIGSAEPGVVYAFGELNPDAPSTPEISGPRIGASGILYNFTFKAESPLGNDLYYWIEWADGSNSGWLGPFESCVNITESHVWDTKGKYPIQAKAKDTNGSVSSWGVLQLSIPRNRATVNSMLFQILEKFPILSRLLQFIK